MSINLWGCLMPCSLFGVWCDHKSGPAEERQQRQQQQQTVSDNFTQMGATQSTADLNNSSGASAYCNSATSSGAGGGNGAGVQASGLIVQSGVVIRERRKKVTGFATLRKRLIRRRRSSKTCDHGRVLREFVSTWSQMELSGLLEEYEALAALKDLSVQAELSRPPATTFKQDLSALYDYKYCTDCDLVFRGTVFPVHRALLSARCPYFRDLLAGCPGYGARICLELRSSPVDISMFSSLLRYLYTGDLCPHDASIDINLLRRLGEDFGTPNPLEHDLRYLLETGDYSDAALVFTSGEGGVGDYHRPDSGSSEYGFRPKLELPCHKAILSARSPFFRGMIQRRIRNLDDIQTQASGSGAAERSAALHVPTRIVLDENVIPKRYARVLLHAIYLDTVDLSLILRGTGCGSSAGSLGEATALTHTGRTRPSPLEEAMELYQIGRFLELDILAQGCEDLILEWLSLDTLSTVLRWGNQPHGSAWVYRQACHYLREEFSAIAASPVLHQLDKSQLIQVLQSNFVQASELEVLQAVMKWGEQELIRRMEDREPNLLSHTAHSVTRKGIKKRDLSDVELREILSELLPHVRMDHVLPPNNEVLNQAIRRGLVSTPPSHMIGDDRESLRINAWIRGGSKNHGLFVRPRLFMPYYEEVKVLLEDQATNQHVELMRMRRSRYLPDIPDIYNVSRVVGSGQGGGNDNNSVDLTATSSAHQIPTPDAATMNALYKREQKLKQVPACQRALALPLTSRLDIYRQIRLRVVREFNLPDEIADLMESSSAACYCVDETGGNMGAKDELLADELDIQPMDEDNSTPPPSPALPSDSIQQNIMCYSRNLTFPRGGIGLMSGNTSGSGNSGAGNSSSSGGGMFSGLRRHHHHHQQELPSTITEQNAELHSAGASYHRLPTQEHEVSSLSEMMPDVAIATGQLNQLQLDPPESLQSMQLDLGDGSSHMIGAGSLQHLQHHRLAIPSTNYHHYMTRGSVSSLASQHQPNQQQQQQQQPSQPHPSSYPIARMQSPGPGGGGGGGNSVGGRGGSSSSSSEQSPNTVIRSSSSWAPRSTI